MMQKGPEQLPHTLSSLLPFYAILLAKLPPLGPMTNYGATLSLISDHVLTCLQAFIMAQLGDVNI